MAAPAGGALVTEGLVTLGHDVTLLANVDTASLRRENSTNLAKDVVV